ncbi:MAG: hypothetical protein EXS42_01580 [Lacunisphaera sp.]|nr:hypothetical protein [Lacunisphaera sp.]
MTTTECFTVGQPEADSPSMATPDASVHPDAGPLIPIGRACGGNIRHVAGMSLAPSVAFPPDNLAVPPQAWFAHGR